MDKDWRTILRFSVIGLAISAGFFAYFENNPSSASSIARWIRGAAIVLCPGSWALPAAIASEPESKDYVLMWVIIGMVNPAVYAVVGAAFVGLRKRPKGYPAN
jgi:hypothetical protein